MTEETVRASDLQALMKVVDAAIGLYNRLEVLELTSELQIAVECVALADALRVLGVHEEATGG